MARTRKQLIPLSHRNDWELEMMVEAGSEAAFRELEKREEKRQKRQAPLWAHFDGAEGQP